MKNVLFVNQKGGCGKSTLAAELVLSCRRSGLSVAFSDLDQQGGGFIDETDNPDAILRVIDTPGALLDDTAAWVSDADIIVIPTRPGSYDAVPLERMIKIARSNKKPDAVIIVVANMLTRWTNSTDFISWLSDELKDTGIIILTVPQSESVPRAAALQQSVVTFSPRSNVAKSVITLCNTIRQKAGLQTE